jgi:YesN/AraC family two-component response regulator
MAVQQVMEKAGYHPERITLGEVFLKEDLNADQLSSLDKSLTDLGFERIDDRKGRLVEAIKNKVIEKIHRSEFIDRKFNWSTVLVDVLHYEYNYLSNLFSSVEGITLEQYIIRQKIERAKELLFYDELNLSEIAVKLGYSSVAHLSGQFKKITGFTPSELKKNRADHQTRKSIDNVA